MRKYIVIAFLLMAAGTKAQQGAQAFSLEEAIQFALQNSIANKNAKLDVDATRYREWEIKSIGMPNIEATFDYNYYYLKPVTQGAGSLFSGGIFGSLFGSVAAKDSLFRKAMSAQNHNTKSERVSFMLPHNATFSATLSQLIFDGRYFVGVKAAKDLSAIQRHLKTKTEFDIKYDVTKAYYQAAAAKSAIAELENLLPIIDKLLSDTRATYKEGLAEELDVDRLELIKSSIHSQIIQQKLRQELAINNLKYQIGFPFNNALIIKDDFDMLYAAEATKALGNFNAQNRIEYQLLETTIKLKGYDVEQKRAGYYPTLVGFVNFGYSGQTDKLQYFFKNKKELVAADPEFGFPAVEKTTQTWWSQGLVGLKLTIPIFDSGKKWAIIGQAKIEQEKAKNDLENFKNASQIQVAANETNYKAAVLEEENAKNSFELAKKITLKTQTKFKEGIGNSFELTQAQQDFVSKKLGIIQAKMNVLMAKTELQKSLGVK